MSQTLPERRAETTAERWEPLSELEQVTERMRRLLEQTFGGFGWSLPAMEKAAWSPLVDLEETDDAYVVEADLPGVRRENVNVELVGNELTITGEAKETERTGTVRRRTRRTGHFDYRLSLPSHVDPEKVDASLSDGVLKVRVPKAERAQRRRIEIKA
ncbi:MAG: Hsp20/alpha crystallin family protein [Gaiellaceae bacterium]